MFDLDIVFRKWHCNDCGISFEAPINVIPSKCSHCGGTHLTAFDTYVDGKINVEVKEKQKTRPSIENEEELKSISIPGTKSSGSKFREIDNFMSQVEEERKRELQSKYVPFQSTPETRRQIYDRTQDFRKRQKVDKERRQVIDKRMAEFTDRAGQSVNRDSSYYRIKEKILRGGSDRRKSELKTVVDNDSSLSTQERDELYRLLTPSSPYRFHEIDDYRHSFYKLKEKILRGGSDRRKSELKTAVDNDSNLDLQQREGLHRLLDGLDSSDSYTPEHAREVGDAGVCEKCGSALIRDPEGHIGCSNLACKNNIFVNTRGRKVKNAGHDVRNYAGNAYSGASRIAENAKTTGSKYSRLYGGGTKRNLKGAVNELHQLYPFDPFYREDLKKEGVNARNETNIKSDIDMIKRDAIDNFKAGKTYKEAVKEQIDTYAGYGWWDKKNDTNKGILRIQKNEVKEVIWDVYKNPHNHGITWADIDGNEDYQKAYKSTRGALGLKNSIMGKLVSHGVESNKVNMGKIAQLQSRLKELDKEEKRWQDELGNINPDDENAVSEERKAQAELEVIRAEIQETLRKIEDIEKHPELAKRMYVRGSGWLGGKKDSVKSHSKRAGGWLTKKGKGIRDGKDKAVNGAVNAYSHHKAMIFGWISTICAFIILIILYYMKVLAGSVYIPVSGWQIFIFMLLAILFEVIKTSMDTDAQSRNEAREIITLLAVLALIFTAAIRDPAVGFWTSLIFCAILSLYLLMDFYTNSALVSIVLAIVMMVVISFTAAGWMNELGVQAEKLAIQTGFAEAIETSIGAVSESMADVWLMITDPNGWYAKQEMEQNAQKDESATDRAVEITTTKITPSIVNLGDEVNLLVEVENFGNRDTTKPARDVEISVTKGENHREHFSLEGSEDEVVRYIGDLMSGTGVQEVFEITAPSDCIATFQLDVGVSYGYDVDAVADIFIIGKKRYDELVKQDKFVPEKQVAKSTSGPVSVSLMTNLPQPIPVDVGTQFSIHFGIVNTRSSSGEINATRVEIAIPTDFIPVLNDEEVYENCKLCELVDSDGTIADDSFVYYSLKEMYDGNSDTCSVNADKSLLLGGDIKIFKCVMQYDGKDDISFKKPKDLHVSMDYIYGYTKTVSFTVRKRDIDVEEDIAMCS